MAFKAPKVSGKTNEPIEAGTYPARLVQVIDLGLQAQRPYMGEEKEPKYEIMVTYELTDEFLKDDKGEPDKTKPRWVSESFVFYSTDAERSKSAKRYLSMDPNNEFQGDWERLLGRPLNVTVVNNVKGDKTYTNVANTSAMRPRDAERCEELVNEAVVFTLDEPNMEVFNRFPEWIQTKIMSNLNFQGSKLQQLTGKPSKEKEPVVEEEEEHEDAPF